MAVETASRSAPPITFAIALRIGIVIFVVQAAVMLLLPLLPATGLPPFADVLIDASALTLITMPIIHIFMIRPSTERAAAALAEARETAAALARSLGRLETTQAILDRHAIVSETDPDGRLIRVNPEFCRLSGYEPGELIGRVPSLLAAGRHDGAFWREMEQAVADGRVWQGELCNRAKDGREYWLACSNAALRGPMGEPIGSISVCADITPAKRREAELAEAHRAAESASEAKSAFLTTMSHELRTPMNGVLGMLDLLLDRDQRKLAEAAHLSADALLAVLNDILDVSALESGGVSLDARETDVPALIAGCIERQRPAAEDKGLSLAAELSPVAGLRLKADAGRLGRILSALIGNAVKFTESGGATVLASQRPLHDGRIELRVSVSDTGIGIAADMRMSVFNRFAQADGSTARRFGGLGLGLAIARMLVERMEGRIGLESAEGEGSRFWFAIPCEPAAALSADTRVA